MLMRTAQFFGYLNCPIIPLRHWAVEASFDALLGQSEIR